MGDGVFERGSEPPLNQLGDLEERRTLPIEVGLGVFWVLTVFSQVGLKSQQGQTRAGHCRVSGRLELLGYAACTDTESG